MKRNIDLFVRKFMRRRGEKPQIVPMEKKCFLYHIVGQGFIITEDPLTDLVYKYANREKAVRFKIDEILLDIIFDRQKGRTKEKEIFDQIDKKQVCALFNDIYEKYTYREMLLLFKQKLDQVYGNPMAKEIFEGIQEYYDTVIALDATAKEKKKNKILLPLGCRHMKKIKEVQMKWDFTKSYHEKFCEAQGFTKEEYRTMMKYLSLDKIREMKHEAISEQDGKSVIWVAIPKEVLFFIKSLYVKKLLNIEGKREERNQILEKGHSVAKVRVVCIDQNGRKYASYYEARFQMRQTDNEPYGYQEEQCHFHFLKI